MVAQDPEHPKYSQYFKFLLHRFSFQSEPHLILILLHIHVCSGPFSSMNLNLFLSPSLVSSPEQIPCGQEIQMLKPIVKSSINSTFLCISSLFFPSFLSLSFLFSSSMSLSRLPIIFLLVLNLQPYASLLNPPWVSIIGQLKFVISYFLFRSNMLRAFIKLYFSPWKHLQHMLF